MKNNKIFKILFFAALLLGLIACEEYTDTETISTPAPEGCLGVYFPELDNAAFELEPDQEKTITLSIARLDSVGAYDAPITVNTEDSAIFIVPATVSFADGEMTADFAVTFPNAEEGVTYNLMLEFLDEENINPYGSGNTYLEAYITRIKWETLTDPLIYVDGAVSSANYPMYVNAEKAQLGESVRYRFKNAFKVAAGAWNGSNYEAVPDADGIYDGHPNVWPGEVVETSDYYTVVEIYDASGESGEVYMAAHDIGFDWGSGIWNIGCVYGYLSDDKDKYPIGEIEDGVITFGDNSLYYAEGDGGAYIAGAKTYIYLTKELFLAANKLIEDFNAIAYDEIVAEVGEFVSVAEDGTWSQTMHSAVDIDAENEESDYKNLYYLSDLYTAGNGLAFYYTEETGFSIPESQPTGLEVFGSDVYVSQSEDIESTVVIASNGVSTYTFGLTFHYEDGTVLGDFSEIYYFAEVAPVVTKENFVGDFLMTGPSLLGGDDASMAITITEGTNDTLLITGMDYAEEVVAIYNADSSYMIISAQYLADFDGDTMTMYTYDGGVGTSDITIGYKITGDLVILDESIAYGYAIQGNAGGYYDAYYNFMFSPSSTKSASVSTSDTSFGGHSIMSNIVRNAQSKSSYKIEGKLNPRRINVKAADALAL